MMKRNIIALLALLALVLGQAAPLAALDRACPMQPSGASLCGVCDFGGTSAQGARVSAASCCKFGAANPAPQTPGVVPTVEKTGAAHAPDGTFASADSRVCITSSNLRSVSPTLRSSFSPRTLGTTLRL